MKRLECDVVVVGGGATGVGIVRDAAMRGFRAILIERADLGQGTTGRYHGLLHSGGRYVVSDPQSARECAAENRIVKRINADAVEATGGLFVSLRGDDPEFPDKFLDGAAQTGVAAEEISPADALRREPRLNPELARAFAVQDASIDGWQLVWGVANSARNYGARILTYHRLTAVHSQSGEGGADRQVTAVQCHDERTGREVLIDCRFVINATGAWAGQVAQMADCHGVEVVPGRGIMIAMNHRLVNSVVNRCIYPSDGDIIVPVHTVSIIGTTDIREIDPDDLPIPRAEVQQMLDSGEALLPGFRQARALHAWAGARPLVKDTRVSSSDTRHMSRGMQIIDHLERDGLAGLLTITGGKLTTYRLMAELVTDKMVTQMGETRPCRTADEAVPGSESGRLYQVTHRLEQAEVERGRDQVLCECELLLRKDFEATLREMPEASLDDLRRQLRLGMGPCQGGFCALRAAGCANTEGAVDAERATRLLRDFLDNRWIGLWTILSGPQVRQTALDHWIWTSTLDVPHLPEEAVR